MGNGRWNEGEWQSYARSHVEGRSRQQIFRSSSMKPEYDPARISLRESRDSADNPQSTPIILASDVTGSMGKIAEVLMRDGLNRLATGIYDRRPVSDPHIMIMAVGDAYTDRAPLQVTQFEADIRVAQQASELWLEGNGGGNHGESYSSAHVFAALKTATDIRDKRGRKGFLFTIGDEPVHDGMTGEQIRRILGLQEYGDMSAAECLQLAERDWEVFHIALANEGYCRRDPESVRQSWQPLLGERLVMLEDVHALSEQVIKLIEQHEAHRVAPGGRLKRVVPR